MILVKNKEDNIMPKFMNATKDSLVSKDGVEADLEHLRKLVGKDANKV